MKNIISHITKGSKLIVIYLLTILISGSILTYLSIHNISNFEELTEKRITEEQQSLLTSYSEQFQMELDKLANRLKRGIDTANISSNNILWIFDEELIHDFMIISKDGAFLRPHLSSILSNVNSISPDPLFMDKYKEAETREFVHSDFRNAEILYEKSLNYAKNSLDSSSVLNALSRLQLKRNLPNQSIFYCEQILNDFYDVVNEFGLPFSYFSINQILGLNDGSLESQKVALLTLFLQRLVNYQIPFTDSTEGLLNEITNSLQLFKEVNDLKKIKSLIQSAREIDRRLNHYQPVIDDFISKNNLDFSRSSSDIQYLTSINSPEEIVLVFASSNKILGFITTLDKLDTITRSNLKMDQLTFNYTLHFINTPSSNIFIKKRNIQNRFSSYFPQYLEVDLKDLSDFEAFILKRSLITFIGLALLLAAMIIGFVLLSQDVSRKRRLTKLRADFVANVTHELKTPLTSINMFADSIVLNRVKNEKDLKKYAKIIVKESEKLKRMITNILDFSRKESNKLTFHFKEESINTLIYEIMEEMNYWLEIHGFEVGIELEKELWANVDKEGIKQVLSNLLTNAIKYSPEKKKIVIKAYKKSTSVFIEIKDYGIGIPKDKHESIFEKFYRVSSEENDSISGTGLGLTVSKDIIEAHKGSLSVTSELNKGSTFIIELNLG